MSSSHWWIARCWSRDPARRNSSRSSSAWHRLRSYLHLDYSDSFLSWQLCLQLRWTKLFDCWIAGVGGLCHFAYATTLYFSSMTVHPPTGQNYSPTHVYWRSTCCCFLPRFGCVFGGFMRGMYRLLNSWLRASSCSISAFRFASFWRYCSLNLVSCSVLLSSLQLFSDCLPLTACFCFVKAEATIVKCLHYLRQGCSSSCYSSGHWRKHLRGRSLEHCISSSSTN